MKKSLLFIILSLMSGSLSAAVEYDARVPQLEFAAQELNAALKEAEPLYKRALSIFEKSLGPDHPNTKTVRRNLDNLK